MLTNQKSTLEELKDQSVEDILNSVLKEKRDLIVLLPDGSEIVIHPKPQLEPLPVLKGSVSEGWKDAVYDGSE